MDTTGGATTAPGTKSKGGRMNLKKLVIGLVAVLLVAATGFLYWDNLNTKKELEKRKNPQDAARLETETLVKEVSKVVELPAGETPTVATVADAGKLKSQAFFARSENGDKVLMYTQAKKAYLYRPSTKKVIEIAPINIDKPTTNTTPTKK